jgi:Fic family protein
LHNLTGLTPAPLFSYYGIFEKMLIKQNISEPDIQLNRDDLSILLGYEKLRKIIDFIQLPEKIISGERNQTMLLRIYFSNAIDNPLTDFTQVIQIIGNNTPPSNKTEQEIASYAEAEKMIMQRTVENISVSMLYDIAEILCKNDPRPTGDGSLYERPSYETEMLLDNLFRNLDADNVHPVVTSWILHFTLLHLHPFGAPTGKIARLLQNFWLQKHNCNLEGLLQPERELYQNKQTYFKLYLGKYKENGVEKAVTLRECLDFGMQMFSNQLKQVEARIKAHFRELHEFNETSSRQKNVLNFVFENGCDFTYTGFEKLSKRQEAIMHLMYKNAFLCTKELSVKFNCNRKTIQRDFSELLGRNMVSILGNGSALKYSVNIKSNKRPELGTYQSKLVREKAVTQAVLFME